MKRLFLILGLCTVVVQTSFSQLHQYKYSAEGQPLWVQLMYAENADWEKVKDEYAKYYSSNPFVKNEHTQYYKHYIHNNAIESGPKTPEQEAIDKLYVARVEQASTARTAAAANWTCLGPFDYDNGAVSRSYAAGAAHVYTTEQSKTNTNVLYAGTATAGVWKSVDKGLNWTLLTKGLLITSVYAIEIDPSDENIVYAGTEGGQLWKTTNGGTSWARLNTTFFASKTVKDIVCHPTTPNIVLVATEGGFYRTTDGGTNFTQIATGDYQEIELHPNDPNIVYTVKGTGTLTQFFKSTNNGVSFTQKTTGWPAAATQSRTEIAVTAAAPNKIYASCTGSINGGSGTYGTYISNDQGETWTFQCCGTGPGGAPVVGSNINMMGWQPDGSDDGGQYNYNFAYAVHPSDANFVLNAGTNLWYSTDGGVNFTCPSKWSQSGDPDYVHADIHDIKIYGNDIWVSTDGGIWYSNNKGANFEKRFKGIAGTDFWGFGIGYGAVGHRVLTGGAYHNGTQLMDNNVYQGGWAVINGGDGQGGHVSPINDRIIFSDRGTQRIPGTRTGSVTSVTWGKNPNNDYTTGKASNVVYSPTNSNVVYVGNTNDLWKSTNGGTTFTSVYSFGEYVSDVEISPLDANLIYVATTGSSRKLWRSTDGGTSWTNITVATSLDAITSQNYDLAVSSNNVNELWAIKVGNSKVFRSTDKGTTWANIYGSNLSGEQIQAITHQAGTDGGVYVSTNKTVYYKNNTLTNWVLFNTGLPMYTPSIKILPDYWGGTITLASSRGIYESPFYEKAAPVAFFKADKFTTTCGSNAPITFIDQSAVEGETGVTRNWVFQGGIASSTTAGTVTVTYPLPGTYDVSLTVTDANGTHTRTYAKFITVTGSCAASTDVALNTVTGISSANKCAQSFTPVAEILNAGTNTINSYTVKVFLDGVLNKTLPQTVTLTMGQKATLSLGTFNLATVSEFKVIVENPNGAADNASNNTNITLLSGDLLTTPGITVVSQSSNYQGEGADKMFDGNNTTIWHNNWAIGAPLPHTLVFNLNGTYNLGGLDMLNRQDNSNGYPKDVEISTSVDNVTWTTPVTTTFAATTNWQTAYFTGSGAKYLRMKVISTISGSSVCSMAEIKLRGCTINAFPTVSITSPINNATFTAPASVTINATAADADGTVSKVEFYNGTTLLGSDATSPYSYTWTGVAAGNYNLTAVATDNVGAVTSSSIVKIVVNVPANVLPVTSITSPANNATFTAPASITINANATDSDGTISKVEFYNGASLLGSDATSPYSYTWTGVRAGNYALTVKATDNSNGVTTSSIVNVVVNPPANVPPVVTITAPTNNSSFTAPATINFTADASDADGTVSKVEFYNGTTLIGTDATAPYAFSWTGVAIGTYTITAKATDNSNAVTTSSAITITVTKAANVLPTVSITAPTNNAVLQAPVSALSVSANATDADGTVSKVVFYNGSTKLGEDATSPYSLIWNNVAAGTYTLKAVAYDNVNDSTTSSISIKVNKAPVTSITSPIDNSNYGTGSNVVINALATDNDGTISKVEFFQGTSLIGSDVTSPYSFTWNNVQDGSYLLKTKVTDNDGGVTYSAGVMIIVGTLTSIDLNNTETKVIYPNPTTGKLYFGKGVSNVQVYSVEGKMLPISYAPSAEFIDLHSLKNGIYVIQFEKDGKHFSEKITKQ